MQPTQKKTIAKFLQYIPIWIGLKLGSMMPFRLRSAFFAAVCGFLIPAIPGSRRRIVNGLKRVFPEMSEIEARHLCKKISRNVGRTLSEILFSASYSKRLDLFDATGPGLDVLKKAKEAGKGAIIVSGHFGQWEAVRHFLKSAGMETGAVYRENSNPWYEPHFVAGIQKGGEPIVAKSAAGNMKMVKHLRDGGFFALLVDQKYQQGHLIPFLGIDALTPTAAAVMALRYDLPLVPAFGTRDENGKNIHVEFEEPIPPSDALTMTREVNDRISARILERPEQWYWLHNRWEDTFLYEQFHGGQA